MDNVHIYRVSKKKLGLSMFWTNFSKFLFYSDFRHKKKKYDKKISKIFLEHLKKKSANYEILKHYFEKKILLKICKHFILIERAHYHACSIFQICNCYS